MIGSNQAKNINLQTEQRSHQTSKTKECVHKGHAIHKNQHKQTTVGVQKGMY